MHGLNRRLHAISIAATILAVCAAPAPAATAAVPAAAYSALHWRLVGPLRGGWATVATGVPGDPATFYFGAADGGVWKTDDAGRTWEPFFEHEGSASIGALAVAPSDPDVLWVGTGQVDHALGHRVRRRRVPLGRRRRDVGPRGAREHRHIGRIWVDPRDANVVLVAALGHMFGPNPERGVFRTEDGGRTWTKVLFGTTTPAPSTSRGPGGSRRRCSRRVAGAAVAVAGLLHADRSDRAAASASSSDGGRTWRAGRQGPSRRRAGPHRAGRGAGERRCARVRGDRRAAAAARALPLRRPAATLDARQRRRRASPATTWRRSRSTRRTRTRCGVMGRSIRTSTDGGETFVYVSGSPGGDDYHFLWIDPKDPRSVASRAPTRARSSRSTTARRWSSWYNQPTGQFYRVAVDDRFPYWIYSGQQDSGTVALASRSDYGQLTFRDWHPVGGDERDGDIPIPGDPGIVYGSGLGGRLSLWDARTGQVPERLALAGVELRRAARQACATVDVAHAARDLAAAAARDLPGGAGPVPLARRRRVLEGGEPRPHRGAIPGRKGCEGDVPVERATACGYGRDLLDRALAARPTAWSGSAPTTGASGSRATTARELERRDARRAMAGLEQGRIDRSLADRSGHGVRGGRPPPARRLPPLAWLTHDYGATWRESGAGLPARTWVNVVRQDPERPGLLYAGTSRGAFVSFDDGERWQSLQLDLPTRASTT